jgi:hypothetical protein
VNGYAAPVADAITSPALEAAAPCPRGARSARRWPAKALGEATGYRPAAARAKHMIMLITEISAAAAT